MLLTNLPEIQFDFFVNCPEAVISGGLAIFELYLSMFKEFNFKAQL